MVPPASASDRPPRVPARGAADVRATGPLQVLVVARAPLAARALIAAATAHAPRTVVHWQGGIAPPARPRGDDRAAMTRAPADAATGTEPALILLVQDEEDGAHGCDVLLVEAWAADGVPVVVLAPAPTPARRAALVAAGAAGVWALPHGHAGWAQAARLIDRCADLSPRGRRRLAAAPD